MAQDAPEGGGLDPSQQPASFRQKLTRHGREVPDGGASLLAFKGYPGKGAGRQGELSHSTHRNRDPMAPLASERDEDNVLTPTLSRIRS